MITLRIEGSSGTEATICIIRNIAMLYSALCYQPWLCGCMRIVCDCVYNAPHPTGRPQGEGIEQRTEQEKAIKSKQKKALSSSQSKRGAERAKQTVCFVGAVVHVAPPALSRIVEE